MKKILFLSVLLLQANFLFAQRYEWESFGESTVGASNGSGGGVAIARDGAGNLYSAAVFSLPIMVQGDTVTPFTTNGDDDIYIAKFNSNGQRIRVWHFGGSWYDTVNDIALDDSANVYVRVVLQGAPIIFEDTIVATGGSIIKFDSSGNFKWIMSLPAGVVVGKKLVYSNGFLFASSNSGLHKVDVHTGLVTSSLYPTFVQSNLFQVGMCVAPNGDIIQAIYFLSGSVSFGGDTINSTLSSDGSGGNIIYMRTDTGNNVIAIKAYGKFYGGITNSSQPIEVDAQNNVYAIALCDTALQFGTSSIPSFNSAWKGVFMKMDSMLNPILATEIHSGPGLETNALLAANGGVYMGGFSGGIVYLNNGDSLMPSVNGDNVLVKFDLNGNVVAASISGNIGGTDRINDLVSGSGGICYFSAQIYGSNPVFSCKIDSVQPGMCVAAFTDGSDAAPIPVITQNGNVLTVTPPFSELIQWYENDTLIAGANGQTFTITEDGVYSVTYLNHYGCSSISDTSFHQWINGISEPDQQIFSIYPNPVEQQLAISSSQLAGNTIFICDVFGRRVLAEELNLKFQIINLETVTSGVYFISVLNSEGKNILNRKIVKL